ncbi:hypothetical protein ACFVJM_28990 [Streptomyces virginiae]|uniref:hypothetical protein n=1 Tax=Streptomyces virginiae TaxID=1961 RepID=UPI003627B0E2
MGRTKVGKPRRERPVTETHEPEVPLPGWPRSHVDSELTGEDEDECVLVTVHGVQHYLHATTARELQTALDRTLAEYNERCEAVNWPGV